MAFDTRVHTLVTPKSKIHDLKLESSGVTLDGPVREEQVLEESVMLTDTAHSPQAEPVSAQRP